MSTQALIVALSRGSEALRFIGGEAENVKVASQLFGLGVAFHDLAVQLRSGALKLSADALRECLREVEEADAAATRARGKSDAERAIAIVEANEAMQRIYAEAQPIAFGPARFQSMASIDGRPEGLTLPPEFGPWPMPWPRPRPWPFPITRPWPWPLPPSGGPWPNPWPPGEFDRRGNDPGGWR